MAGERIRAHVILDALEWMEDFVKQSKHDIARIERLEVEKAALLEACKASKVIIGVYDEGVGLTLEERQLEKIIDAAILKARPAHETT